MNRSGLIALATLAAIAINIAPIEASNLWYSTLQWDSNPQTLRLGTIRSIHDDGTNDVTVLNLGGDTTYPKPSPDGQWLYFQSNITWQYSVYRSRLDGTEVTNLGVMAHQLGSQWQGAATFGVGLSGDGGKITYTIHDGVLGKVIVANADGSNPQFPAPHLDYTYMSDLNYTGDRVTFSGPAQNYRLLSVQLPGTQVQSLTPSHPDSYVPQFAGNGNTIIFVRNDGDIYSVGTGGQTVQRLTNGNNYYEFHWSEADQHGSTDGPSISPDGTKIAYIRKVSGVPQVHTMNVDGSNQQQLTFGSSASGRVVWSPDGQELAFVTFVGDYPQLFVMNAQGGTPQQLTNLSERGVYWVAYQPNLPGDFDSDGDVDGADFVVWQTHFPTNSGATLAMGDADQDGDVDGADFVVWQSHFPTGGSPGIANVPEPASCLLALGGLFAFIRRRFP